jgi:hypothetical protein
MNPSKYNRANFRARLSDYRFQWSGDMQEHRARLVQRSDHPHSCHDANALFVRLGAHRMHHATFLDQTLINTLTTSVSPYSSCGLPDTTSAEDSSYSSSTQLTLTNATTGGGYAASITIGVHIT